jgi:hypothetical protein
VRAIRPVLARDPKSEQTDGTFHVPSPEVPMTHASMLKSRRQIQKNKKLIVVAAKQAKRATKLAAAGPVVKKEKVKKEKIVKEKVKAEKVEKVKKVKLTAEELGKQEAKRAKEVAAKKAG